jgi:hypothetical protein
MSSVPTNYKWPKGDNSGSYVCNGGRSRIEKVEDQNRYGLFYPNHSQTLIRLLLRNKGTEVIFFKLENGTFLSPLLRHRWEFNSEYLE